VCCHVLVFGQQTDFTYRSTQDLYCAPALIQFTQQSSGQPKGFIWTFGNGEKSNKANPLIRFNTPGTYRVKLLTVWEKTTAEVVKTIQILPGVSNRLDANRDEWCTPGPVQFNASGSSNIVSHEWNFGDGSEIQAGNADQITHTYTQFGQFTVTLKSLTASGCYATATKTINISRPIITATLTRTNACTPSTVQLQATVAVPGNFSISQYSWNNGNGQTINTTTGNIPFTYTQPGVYVPSLTIDAGNGCSNTFLFDSVKIGRPPSHTAAYTVDPVICGSEVAKFVAHDPEATSYDWNFGGNSVVNTRDTFIEKKFSSLGIHQVTVTPKYFDCPGNPITLQVEVVGVIAEFNFNNSCLDRRKFSFRNTSQGNVSTLNWQLGDNAPNQYTPDFTHVYPPQGSFPVKLTVTDNLTGCVDSTTRRIYTARPTLLNASQSICLHSNTQFRIANNYSNPALTQSWHVLDHVYGPNNQPTLPLVADSLGYFNNQYAIIENGPAYCPDTIFLDHPILVKGPKLLFDVPENNCVNKALVISNRSVPYLPGDSIRSWYWDFGNNQHTDEAYQPAPYVYPDDRGYNITLRATDINGCKDTLTKPVNIRPMPFIWLIPHADSICQGRTSRIIAYTSDQLLWTSSNQTSICNSCDSAAVTPQTTTRLRVSATNAFNCISVDSAEVFVHLPFTARPAMNDTAVCEKQPLRLDVEPRDKIIRWSPPQHITDTTIYNPIVQPPYSTTYVATLNDSVGCFQSTVSIPVTIKSLPRVNAGPDKYLSYASPFTLQPNYSSNIRQFLWSPSDSLSCATCPYPTSLAYRSKEYTVQVVSDSGCVSKDAIYVYIDCRGGNILMPSAFTPNNDGRNDLYRPIARGMQLILRFAVFNRLGQLLYETKNLSPEKSAEGWDGRYKGTLQDQGAYVYTVEALCETGNVVSSRGSFILIR
jgi:gliding motility-associated-like protein